MCQRRRRARERHMLEVHPGLLIHDHSGILGRRTQAIGGKAQISRMGLYIADQAFEVFGGQARRTDQYHARLDDGGDRLHVIHGIVRHLHHVRDLRKYVVCRHQDGLAIRRCRQKRADRDGSASTRFVVDDHRLAKVCRKLVGQQACNHVHRAAGGSRHQDTHRLVGPRHGSRHGNGHRGGDDDAAHTKIDRPIRHRCLLSILFIDGANPCEAGYRLNYSIMPATKAAATLRYSQLHFFGVNPRAALRAAGRSGG
ncbi:hypothetical protein CBM2589_U20004 [Cupriavidus taiwanensis]|uniref:Uncharacterized protein n=1 Tax=Cupriavidus taiwanensis TaxID=164546 RepID=A0A375CS14_9BURK|nr:hypothetical protein CBM2589_U20004 [Cupriavidus taiwanensis]